MKSWSFLGPLLFRLPPTTSSRPCGTRKGLPGSRGRSACHWESPMTPLPAQPCHLPCIQGSSPSPLCPSWGWERPAAALGTLGGNWGRAPPGPAHTQEHTCFPSPTTKTFFKRLVLRVTEGVEALPRVQHLLAEEHAEVEPAELPAAGQGFPASPYRVPTRTGRGSPSSGLPYLDVGLEVLGSGSLPQHVPLCPWRALADTGRAAELPAAPGSEAQGCGKGLAAPRAAPHAYPLRLDVFLRSRNRFQIILGGPWCVIPSAVIIVWSRGAWQRN